jgi:ATP-binding cassette subfamily B protein
MVVWLDHGRVRGVDTHRRLWQDPEYRALFAPGEAAPEKAEPLVPAGSES